MTWSWQLYIGKVNTSERKPYWQGCTIGSQTRSKGQDTYTYGEHIKPKSLYNYSWRKCKMAPGRICSQCNKQFCKCQRNRGKIGMCFCLCAFGCLQNTMIKHKIQILWPVPKKTNILLWKWPFRTHFFPWAQITAYVISWPNFAWR